MKPARRNRKLLKLLSQADNPIRSRDGESHTLTQALILDRFIIKDFQNNSATLFSSAGP